MRKFAVPSVYVVVLLLLGVFVGVYLTQTDLSFVPRADPEQLPKEIKLTNVSENSFTVSWVTDIATSGYVVYGTGPDTLSSSIPDDRDELSGQIGNYITHHVTVRGLAPETKYYFGIGSGTNSVYYNNGQPFQVDTPAVLGPPPPADTTYGKLLTPAQTPILDGVVYVSLNGAQPMSALIRDQGNYAISLSTARTTDLSNYVSYNLEEDFIDILYVAGPELSSKVQVQTNNDQPVQDIIIGQTTGLLERSTSSENTNTSSIVPENKFNLESVSSTSSPKTYTSAITINELPTNNVRIFTTQPTFSGIAPNNTELTLTLNTSEGITDTISSGSDGNWEYEVPGELSIGEYFLNLEFTDDDGSIATFSRNFIVEVSASDSTEFLQFTATPSGEISPTVTPTIVVSPSPTPGITTNPTVEPTPEPTQQVAQPTNTVTPSPTTIPQGDITNLPEAGNEIPTIIISLISGLSLIAGLLIVTNKKNYGQ